MYISGYYLHNFLYAKVTIYILATKFRSNLFFSKAFYNSLIINAMR